jgi:RNA polymerase sigma-70 factor, ECF subfamily
LSTDATERVLSLSLLTARRRLAVERQQIAPPSVHSDEELLERLQNCDEKALLVLLHRYQQLAFSIGCRVLRDEGEAEDLVQEVFLQLHSRENTFDATKGSARTWLVQMVYRRAFDRRAYLTRRHFYSGTDVEEHTNAIEGGKSFEEDVIERLTVQQLKAAFTELTDKQRETLGMFFFEGLTLLEIAERLDEDVKNVRHHYYRGLERLRQTARAMMHRAKSEQ